MCICRCMKRKPLLPALHFHLISNSRGLQFIHPKFFQSQKFYIFQFTSPFWVPPPPPPLTSQNLRPLTISQSTPVCQQPWTARLRFRSNVEFIFFFWLHKNSMNDLFFAHYWKKYVLQFSFFTWAQQLFFVWGVGWRWVGEGGVFITTELDFSSLFFVSI